MRRTIIIAGAIALGALAAPADAQRRSETLRWSGAGSAGAWVHIYNMNGDVRIEPSPDGRVHIEAVRSWRRSDPATVTLRTVASGDAGRNVLICALWPNGECDERGYRTRRDGNRSGNNDVGVDMVVRVPRGMHVRTETVNGDMTVGGATGEVHAETVNGTVSAVSSGGPVFASTVNGDVRVSMGRLTLTRDATYETVNGNVEVEVEGDVDAQLELETVNGSYSTNFPVTIQGRLDRRHLRTTLGRGGSRLKLETVNGNVRLTRRAAQ